MDKLEERIRVLEDTEAIKGMKSAYAFAFDERRYDDAADYFTDDAIVGFGHFGTYTGKKELARHWIETTGVNRRMTVHNFGNPIIKVNGNAAKGTWYFNVAAIAHGKAQWTVGRYDDEYVKVGGHWLHKKMKCTFAYDVPVEEGWDKLPQPGFSGKNLPIWK